MTAFTPAGLRFGDQRVIARGSDPGRSSWVLLCGQKPFELADQAFAFQSAALNLSPRFASSGHNHSRQHPRRMRSHLEERKCRKMDFSFRTLDFGPVRCGATRLQIGGNPAPGRSSHPWVPFQQNLREGFGRIDRREAWPLSPS